MTGGLLLRSLTVIYKTFLRSKKISIRKSSVNGCGRPQHDRQNICKGAFYERETHRTKTD
nr:MAG TPA: hypothetical protein [Caudoviricetes sp.]